MGNHYVNLEASPEELDIFHQGMQRLLEDQGRHPIVSFLTSNRIMRISEDLRNASNDKLQESTILSGRISWSKKLLPPFKERMKGVY